MGWALTIYVLSVKALSSERTLYSQWLYCSQERVILKENVSAKEEN